MAKEKANERTVETDTTDTTFHQVQSLIPVDQELLTVEPTMRVADALKLMLRHRYSQLPVVVGQAVLGVFSYRSFSEKVLTKQKGLKGEWLGELPVEDFLEDYEFVHGSQDWNRIVDYLNRDDAFFVGHPDGMDGLVTTMDVLDYFRKVSSPFIVLAEIEMSLRKLIKASIDSNNWVSALENSLSTAYEGKAVPKDLGEMTFDNYVQIISNSGNWQLFEAFFEPGDVSRKQTTRKLQQLRDWRNIVFHLKRNLEPWELDTLAEHRAWLQRRIRAFEAKQKKPATGEQLPKPKQGKLTRERLVADSNPDAVEFFEWLLREAKYRAQDYAIQWHKGSFSVRLRRKGGLAGIAYGYPPNNLQIYFGYVDLPASELTKLRHDLLGFGIFTTSGDHSLNAQVSNKNDFMALRAACNFLLERLSAQPS